MKTFDTFETVENMRGCVKRPIVVHAKQIMEEFRVNTLEGNYKQGKPGDYLMRGIDGELYICDRAIFEKTYNWSESANEDTLETVEVEFDDAELLTYMKLAHDQNITFNDFVHRALVDLIVAEKTNRS
jgi:hypothetical protein